MKVVRKCAGEHSEDKDKAQLLSLLHCLFEAQDPSLCQLVVDQPLQNIPRFRTLCCYSTTDLPDHFSKLDLCFASLNPADCLSLGYFLTYIRNDFDVDLHLCSIGAEGSKTLFREGRVYHHLRKF